MSQENEQETVSETQPKPVEVPHELQRLVELAVKYPEIGPPLAELAFRIGQPEAANRLMRMGLEGASPGLEYYFVAANAARRERRFADALQGTLDAVRSFAAAPDEALAPDDGTRLLHLVRLGFATLMFDLADVAADPGFVRALAEGLPGLDGRLGQDPFYRALLAQTYWFDDKAKSEVEWDRATAMDEPELTWNARGTWYKEAEHDADKAERTYRAGLDHAPRSALLRHNIAQLLVEKAARPDVDEGATARLLKEAEDLLRQALREESPKGLRRHIHASRDRLVALRASLPSPRRGGGGRRDGGRDGGGGRDGNTRDVSGEPDGNRREPAPPAQVQPVEEEREPVVGEVLTGRVASLTAYGAFVGIGGRQTGLLHKSEMSHDFVADPAHIVKVGDEIEVKIIEVDRRGAGGKLRIGLSRKALLPAPAPRAQPAPAPRSSERRRDDRRDDRPADRPAAGARQAGPPPGGRGRRDERRDDRRDDRAPPPAPPPGEKFPMDGKLASLGEMILAKLQKQQKP